MPPPPSSQCSVGGSWNVIGLGVDQGTWGWRDEQALGIIAAHNAAAGTAAAATDGQVAAASQNGAGSQAAEPAGR